MSENEGTTIAVIVVGGEVYLSSKDLITMANKIKLIPLATEFERIRKQELESENKDVETV